MGPASMGWYRDRGLTQTKTQIATENTMFTTVGEPFTSERITTHYSSGRIDTNVGEEIYVPPMLSSDWHSFSEWLKDVETMAVWSLENLEVAYNHRHQQPIRWA